MDRVLRILQIEDSQDDAELIQRELRRRGFSIEALRVETATAMAVALRERDWDLVVSDYDLPGFGGIEALCLLQASGMDIPFVVVSGAIGEEVAVAAMKAGAHDYVFKGNLARLGQAVERELKEADIRRKQRAAEEILRQSERRYRALFEHFPTPTWVKDLSGAKRIIDAYRDAGVRDFRTFFGEHPEEFQRCVSEVKILDANARSLAFFGCQSKDDIALNLPRFFLESSRPVFKEVMITLAEGGRTFDGEVAVQDLKGALKIVSLNLSVNPGFEESLGQVLVSFSDITHHTNMERSLKETRASLERAQALAHLGSLEWELTQERPQWSLELFRIFGLDPAEGVPTFERFTALIHPDDRARVRSVLDVLQSDGGGLGLEFRICKGDGEIRHVHAELEGTQGTLWRMRGTVQDITERKHLETVLQDMEKLSAKAQMAAYIAHEINNPLAGIKNAFALIEGAIPAAHPRHHYIKLIKREIDRIAGIIRTMYHVYRPQTADITDVPLQEAFQDIQDLLVPKCRNAGVEIVLDLPGPGFVIHMNPGLLRQILFNLVQNAVEASPPKGVVTVRAARTSGQVLVTVEDHGRGIPPGLADRIFEAGFTTKRDSGMCGLGLGLSACRNLVESLGGSLAFTPCESGQGVQFQVRLPDIQA